MPSNEVVLKAMRSQGAGGQNVNKVSTAMHLRFDIAASSLPEHVKNKLLARKDRRIGRDGVIVIKAQRHRTQDKNRTDALSRLSELVAEAAKPEKKRKKTKPTKASRIKRREQKTARSRIKDLRKRVDY